MEAQVEVEEVALVAMAAAVTLASSMSFNNHQIRY
jgi:hypothetical protein